MDSWRLYTVACSDSELAQTALRVCIERIIRIGDKVNAFHVYLQDGDKGKKLEKSVNALLLTKMPSCEFNLVWERLSHKHLIVQILKFVFECQSHYLFVGFSEDDIFMSSLLSKCPCHLFIIKSSEIPTNQKSWGLCVQNSPKSLSSFTLLQSLISPQDTLCLFHVQDPASPNISSSDFDPSIPLYTIEKENSVAESIISFISQSNFSIDFLVVSIDDSSFNLNRSAASAVGRTIKNLVKYSPGINILILK